jgi:hypothetical protein
MLWVDRVGDRCSWAILVPYFSEKKWEQAKKGRSGQKERKEGLWKLTPLMEIRKERGFPQRLEKSLAHHARLFHKFPQARRRGSTQTNQVGWGQMKRSKGAKSS